VSNHPVATLRRVPAPELDLAATARAIGEPPRAAMLLWMMDGLAHPARELAEVAGVSPSTASGHLHRLVVAGLVVCEPSGRLRLHRLASPEVSAAIEALATVSPLLPTENLRDARRGSRLQFARICYSHLGGALAVAVHRRLDEDGVVRGTSSSDAGLIGSPLLSALGIADLDGFSGPTIRHCRDWTERTDHLAGRLGTAILQQLLALKWIQRRSADRSVRVTDLGSAELGGLGVSAAVGDTERAAATTVGTGRTLATWLRP
jgi:DNA-binding transcriptional ArsR family regulator